MVGSSESGGGGRKEGGVAMKGHKWVNVLYPDCISVSVPAAILNYSFGGRSHWGELGKGCMGSLYYFSELGVK